MVATRSASKTAGGRKREEIEAKEAMWHKGVAISMWQNSGDDMVSNWSHFIAQKWPFKSLPFGFKRYAGKWSVNERSPNTWDRYEEDIACAAKAGCNAFRLSIEWARVEPERGYIDMDAVARYHAIFDSMEAAGIEPNATLHHFVQPQWFEELGGFEKEENIPLFVDWAVKAVELFGSRVYFWATFNEPTCYMFLGWIAGMHCPGKLLNCMLAGRVLSNVLKAHVAAYHAIKASPAGRGVSVGLVHHHITFLATGPRVLKGLAQYSVDWMNYWWGYDLVHRWMLTGHFTWDVPVLGRWIEWRLPEGRPPCDWFGVNYYSRAVVTWYMKPWCLPGEVMTDMYYPIYAEGLYKTLMQASQYDMPIYITETGIADRSDANRAYMIDSYMRATLRAIKDGADVRGLFYWTLVDNFEWHVGYKMEFGLYAWKPDGSVDRKLKEGAKMLVRYFKNLPNTMEGVQAVVAKMSGLPRPEQLSEAADEAREGLLTGTSRGLASPGGSGRRRRHAATLAAAT